MAQAAAIPISRRSIVLGAAAATAVLATPTMVAAVVGGANSALFALERELITAGEREEAAWAVFNEADKSVSAWERKFPRPEYDKDAHAAARHSDAFLRKFSESRREWRRRRQIVQEQCDLEHSAAYAKAHADEVRRLCERIDAIPATTIAGLKCKARCAAYNDFLEQSVIRDLLAWEAA